MGYTYLVALLLGGGFLAIQLFLGGHDDGDLHAALDSVDHGDGGGHASAWLSPRFFTFALFGFGFAGAAIHYLGLAGPVATLVAALAAGLGSGAAAVAVFRTLSARDASSTATLLEAEGQLARLLLPCGPGLTGKVRVTLKGQLVDILATTEDGPIDAGRPVVVISIRGDVANVVAAPEALEP